MTSDNHQQLGFAALVGRLAHTGLGAFQNRLELAAVEWQEERVRLAELMLWMVALLFLSMLGMLLLTATIIFLFPETLRIYVAAGFTLLYLVGALAAWFGAKSLIKREPFSATIEQVRKDRQLLESLK